MLAPKVLVANRGEIAIRVLRSARELGWRTVALYTTEPALDASHATYADEAVKLSDVAQYMDVAAIVEIAVTNHCTHVHPGYGFLSESPALANALAQLQPPITFVGPTADTLRLAGDKVLSRDLAASLGVQVAPGIRVKSSDDVRSFASRSEVHYPVMIKALDGGGGRGIRFVNEASGVEEAFKSQFFDRRCMGESPSGQVFAEKALTGPGWKHIEIQVIGDGTGAANHFWERECSVQRRCARRRNIPKDSRGGSITSPRSAVQPLVAASLKIARHLRYKGLGTFEFLVNASTYEWVFLEINPRVQVEHTITEEVMDVDLVRAQLLLFSPSSNTTLSSLSLASPPPPPSSTSIQLRLTAENPENGFSLSPGTIYGSDLQWPAGHGVRIDTWLSSTSSRRISSWVVGTDFDSLLAKIIVRGGSFDEATQKAQRALRELTFGADGKIKTNINVLIGVLDHPDWRSGAIDTLWLERHLDTILGLRKSDARGQSKEIPGLRDILDLQQEDHPASPGGPMPTSGANTLLQPGSLFYLTISPSSTSTSLSSAPLASGSVQESKKHTLTLTSIAHNAFPEKLSGVLQSTLSPTPLTFSLSQSASAAIGGSGGFELADPNDPQQVAAPLTGRLSKYTMR
ncbi:hypothetical protein D9756_008255 [Leucocoprinus leucothites]|uniref:Pyruvate carboxylase n=1 Tax=Leucocoprinus leucothites TaxID=201217 RepID=A0A8H5D0I4_9AGAR|nr:hypothetical protein D9756_008255 [Leucoagaricus leucothites]